MKGLLLQAALAVTLLVAVSASPLGGFDLLAGRKPTTPTSDSPPPGIGERVVQAFQGVVGGLKRNHATPTSATTTTAKTVTVEGTSHVRKEPVLSESTTQMTSTSTVAVTEGTTAKASDLSQRTGAESAPQQPGEKPTAKPAEKETTSKPSGGSPATDPMADCYQKFQDAGDEEKNKQIDILEVLLEYGGFPGTMNVNWTRNATNPEHPDTPDPDRWTYFYGDTDYKTYIRIEKGTTHSKTTPQGQPENIVGDIYWAPDDLCGRMRHAVYVHGVAGLEADVDGQLCWIADEQRWCTRDINCLEGDKDKCGRGGLNGALMASLVG